MRKKPCWKLVWEGFKNFQSLKYGVKFFSYDNSNNNFLKTDMGTVPARASFFDNAKLGITFLIAVGLFFGIIINFFKILGTEKS